MVNIEKFSTLVAIEKKLKEWNEEKINTDECLSEIREILNKFEKEML